MNKNTTATVLIVVSVVAFFAHIDPTYSSVEQLTLEREQLEGLSQQAEELSLKQGELTEQYATFQSEMEDDITAIVPFGRDDARTLMTLNSIASDNTIALEDLRVTEGSPRARGDLHTEESGAPYTLKTIEFQFNATYEEFAQFLTDIERSRRIFDPALIEFQSSATGVYRFTMTLHTYWLEK